MKPRLVICRSNPVAPDPRVEKEARTLLEAGYDVTVLGWDRTAQLPQHETLHGIPCYRLPVRAEYASGIRNLPALLRWQWSLFAWLSRRRREYDLIHACDFDTVLPALVCRSLFHKKVVYDIFDFYADHLRLTPGLIKNAIRSVDLRAIGWADAVILADDSRWEQIRGSRPRLSTVIYNSPEGLNSTTASGYPEKPASIQSASQYKLTIVYVGLLQVERGLFELIDVLRQHPEWSLDLAGFGGDEARILDQIGGMSNVHWHGRVPYQVALYLSAAADVLIATYDPAIPNHRFSSPNKVFEAMLLGKPIIVAQDTNMDRIILKADCGLVIPYGDKSALEAALSRLDSEPATLEGLGANARQAYESTYSWKIMQHRLVNLYQQVAGG